MEPQDKRLVKNILIATGVIIGIILIAAYVDSANLLKRDLLSLKTTPCTTGPCTQCYGLKIQSVCLGIMKVTTKIEVVTTANPEVSLTSPQLNQQVKSPVTITGKAKGGWYFEGSFPIELIDEAGQVIGSTTAKASGDWMTDNFVPFTANLTFTPVHPSGKANLVLRKDNPSGIPENKVQVTIPVSY